MPKTMSATEARVHFGEVLRIVDSDGDRVIVEKGGRPIAAIVPVRELDALKSARAESWLEGARRSREMVASWYRDEPIPDVDELINYGRDDVS